MPAESTDVLETIASVRVAVVDIGSNSVRLLIASVAADGVVSKLGRDRVYLRLGDDAYRLGKIGRRKLDELAATAELFARRARAARVERLESIVTAPGRQAENVDELVEIVAGATSAPVLLLSAEDEGRLAFAGAVASMPRTRGTVAVVDLGGGSCEVAVGSTATGAESIRSWDAGALRITRAVLPSPRPSRRDLEAARDAIRELLDDFAPVRADEAFAVGGTARAVSKLVGPRYGADILDVLAEQMVGRDPKAVTAGSGIARGRLETLLGGTLVLAEVARRLDTDLEVARGGVREGAVLALARTASIAA